MGGRERSRIAQLSARMRAVLPKAKDKVQATETQVDTEDKVRYFWNILGLQFNLNGKRI